MKVFDLNVNGFKAFLDKGGSKLIREINPDIVCLQETRTNRAVRIGRDYKFNYHNKSPRKGYAGTMIYSKIKPIKNLTKQYDFSGEGRIQVLEYEDFILVNVYVPSSLRNPERFSYRLNFNDQFIKLIKRLDEIKPVLICGDFNCARSKNDMDSRSKEYETNEFLVNEREILLELENLGFYDPFRRLYRNKKGIYSWRSPRSGDDFGSQGRRLDYCYLSRYFPKDFVENVTYLSEAEVSDHYPMVVEFGDIEILKEDNELRKEWEKIDLDEAKKACETLIDSAKRAYVIGDKDNYQRTLIKMANSKQLKALAVDEAFKSKAGINTHRINCPYANNKMRALKAIDLKNHQMDPVQFFEIEEKGKNRYIGKLSDKDYIAHYMVAQLLKPYHELECDTHSYAYIKNRSHIDMHNILDRYLTENENLNYIVILDVESFFDSLNHDWLCRHIPIPSYYLKNILKTTNIIRGKSIPSDGKGISMGSPAAAYLANITLNGIEEYVIQNIREIYGQNAEIQLLRFSDDIVILTDDKSKADFAWMLTERFLAARKLKLNKSKCKMVNFRKEPFILMNWRYRFYNNNLHVEPTEERIDFMKKDLLEIVSKAKSQSGLIKRLNEKINGWGSDLRYCDSAYIFWDLDNFIEDILFEKTDNSHRFLDSEVLLNRYFVSVNGRLHFCLPKDKSSQLKKLSATPLVKEFNITKDISDTMLQVRRVNEKYRGVWRRQNGCCAICGERILPNEERRLINLNGRDSYIHKECKDLKVYQNDVVFDLTTPDQIERAIEMQEPFLEDNYIFPGLDSKEEEILRRELHKQENDSIEFCLNDSHIKEEFYNQFFENPLRIEGYLSLYDKDKVIARKQQERKRFLKLPEWLGEILTKDDIFVLKNFMGFLKSYYKL